MNGKAAVAVIVSMVLGMTACSSGEPDNAGTQGGGALNITPDAMSAVGSVSDKFQSYNIEMLELTGGSFWKPYGAPAGGPAPAGDTPPGMDPNLYEYRPPIDLANPRLRMLASALGPAYVRSSGTWANATYFPDSDAAPAAPPPGFKGVLTRQQWHGLIDFANAVNGRIVTSFAISDGVRGPDGVWTPEQARRLIDYTKSAGGSVAAAEFMNEPNAATMGSAPEGYDAAAYGRDFTVFHDFVRQAAPDMLIMGPGSVGEAEGPQLVPPNVPGLIGTEDMLKAMTADVDVFSYHHYGAASERCAEVGITQTSAEDALSEQWLSTTDRTAAFYRQLRDRYEPGKPMWVSETADAACGGNPWAVEFLDTFRYLDQLGRLARQGVEVVMHNTLAASDYGLLDESTFMPRPNYWGALLWRKLMGTTVLDSGAPIQQGLHVYAHCLRDEPGGVAIMAINTDAAQAKSISVPVAAQRYTLSSADLQSPTVQLNGATLELTGDGQLPQLDGAPTAAGDLTLDPATITFLAMPEASNAACR